MKDSQGSSEKIMIAGVMLLVLILVNLFFNLNFSSVEDQSWREILFKIRMPRTTVALLAGAILAVNGLLLQNWLHNPIAAPYVLGIESMSTLGILIWMLATHDIPFISIPWLQQMSYAFVAITCSFIGMLGILWLFRWWKNTNYILIAGLLIGGLVSGLVSSITSMVPIERMKGIYLWGMGSFENVYGIDLVILLTALLVTLALIVFMRKDLSVLALGEDYAKTMGVNTERLMVMMIVLTSLGVGAITAYCGPVGFISIIIPQLARRWWRRGSFDALLAPVAILGACCALMAQWLCTLPQAGLPLNAVLGILGFPILIWIIWSARRAM